MEAIKLDYKIIWLHLNRVVCEVYVGHSVLICTPTKPSKLDASSLVHLAVDCVR